MAGGKRASMREGPLAALFRGTAELEAEEREQRQEREQREAAQREEIELDEPRVPSPQERLRAAFSSDVPENVMAPPPPPAPPPPDPYARGGVEPTFGQARAVGGPVIRVIGVGGAGVNAVNRMIEAE